MRDKHYIGVAYSVARMLWATAPDSARFVRDLRKEAFPPLIASALPIRMFRRPEESYIHARRNIAIVGHNR